MRTPHPRPLPEGEGARLRARTGRLLCGDVGGVLPDAGMYYGPDGEVLKKFNTRDGMGLGRVREVGVAVAIISGEDSAIVHARAAKLKIDEVFSGVADKLSVVKDLAAQHGLELNEVAYIGDDLNDMSAMERVGLPCAVADAAAPIKAVAHYVTQQRG